MTLINPIDFVVVIGNCTQLVKERHFLACVENSTFFFWILCGLYLTSNYVEWRPEIDVNTRYKELKISVVCVFRAPFICLSGILLLQNMLLFVYFKTIVWDAFDFNLMCFIVLGVI